MSTDTIQKAPPLTVDERNYLAGEGTISAAMTGGGIKWVYCCDLIRGDDWHEHVHDHPEHEPYAIQREQVWGTDPILFLDANER